MAMKITFLGTGAMIPTAERNHTSILLSYEGENILVDCGEGTQRQLRLAKVSPAKITKILISHWHGDHVLGIPGLIQTLGASEYSGILEVYGPIGTKKYFGAMFESFINEFAIEARVFDIGDGVFFESKDFKLEALSLEHSCRCLGYSFIEKDKRNINLAYTKKFGLVRHPILKELQEGRDIEWKGQKIEADKATTVKKGRKITFIMDTGYSNNIIKLAKDADLLISEATHLDELREKTEKYKHLTAKQAAELAKEANAKRLVLTHFSQRYNDLKEVEKEAKSIFKNSVCAKDFMEIEV